LKIQTGIKKFFTRGGAVNEEVGFIEIDEEAEKQFFGDSSPSN